MFNGVSDYVNANNSFQSVFQKDFSITVWCKPDFPVSPHTMYVLGTSLDSEEGWCGAVRLYLFYNPGLSRYELSFYYSVQNQVDALVRLTDKDYAQWQGQWHYLSATVKQLSPYGFTLCLYVDGRLKGTTDSAVNNYALLSRYLNPWNLIIGNEGGENDILGSGWWEGIIDNVKIFNKALPQPLVLIIKNKNLQN